MLIVSSLVLQRNWTTCTPRGCVSSVFWVLNEALIERFITRITVTEMGEEGKKKGGKNTKDKMAVAATWAQVTFPSPAASIRLFICLIVAFLTAQCKRLLMKEEEKMAVRTFPP